MTGNPVKLRALALAFPRTQRLETWLPVSGCYAFMSGNAFVLAGSPRSPPVASASALLRRAGQERVAGVCVLVAR